MPDALRKSRSDISALTKEKEKLSKLVSDQDQEKQKMEASHGAMVKELESQADSLQVALKKYKEVLPERYRMGYAKGARDYMKSTWKVMPNLEWALLGDDAVGQVETFKAEVLAESWKPQTPIHGKSSKLPAVSQTAVTEHATIPGLEVTTPVDAVEDSPGKNVRKTGPIEEDPSLDVTADPQAPRLDGFRSLLSFR